MNYLAEGKQAFWDAIHSEEYLSSLKAYGAFEDKELIGIIATRNEATHVALFFVKGIYFTYYNSPFIFICSSYISKTWFCTNR